MSPKLPSTSRVDLGELKTQLVKRLGAVRSRRYFCHLHKFLSQRLSKSEFNKFCFLTLGRENLPLHNQLIRSILRNAFLAKAPPPTQRKSVTDAWGNGDILASPLVVQHKGDLCSCDFVWREQSQNSEQDSRLSSKDLEEVPIRIGGGILEQSEDWNMRASPLRAPLGIPYCRARIGRTKRYVHWEGNASAGIDGLTAYLDNAELCQMEDLRKRMEGVTVTQGMSIVMEECAVLLKNGLDAYLKRLIKSCIELVRARMDCKSTMQLLQKQEINGKVLNNFWLDNHTHWQRSNCSLELEEKSCCLVTVQDFLGAMELNSQQLGTNAPLLLEKIRLHSLKE